MQQDERLDALLNGYNKLDETGKQELMAVLRTLEFAQDETNQEAPEETNIQ